MEYSGVLLKRSSGSAAILPPDEIRQAIEELYSWDLIYPREIIVEIAKDFQALYQDALKRENAAQEQQEQQEAHIAEVTAMELPMNWENVFSSDDRTELLLLNSLKVSECPQ
ncbi:MAG: hypothetical protein IJ060_12595 [Oscillospiraceae bacterium]|nr:hypothetical protein [Oscillospiraceae bacterium]